jgi:hypothetical protein
LNHSINPLLRLSSLLLRSAGERQISAREDIQPFLLLKTIDTAEFAGSAESSRRETGEIDDKSGGRGRLGGVCGLNDVTIVFGRFPSPSPLPRGFPAMSLAPVAPLNVSTNHDSEAKCEDQTPFFIRPFGIFRGRN